MPSCFSAIFSKGDNFCDFLLSSPNNKFLSKMCQLLKERICSNGSKFFPLRVDTCSKESKFFPLRVDTCSKENKFFPLSVDTFSRRSKFFPLRVDTN